MKQIVIKFDDEHDYDETIEEVLRLVREGFTSGYEPTWEIQDVKE